MTSEAAGQRFRDQVAIVTGGANGLGRGIAEAFIAEGASVVVVDIVPPGWPAPPGRRIEIVGDVSDPEIGERAVKAALGEAGAADFLVNDAGAYPDGTLLEMPLDDWDRVWKVNVTGTFLMSQAFVRHRPAELPGAIVNISSGSARSPRPGGGAYAASKAAIEVLTRTHAMELGRSGVRVNAVAPGYIDVRGYTDAFPDRASDATRAALVESAPLGRAGRHQDIAAAVLFLCSEEASFITGTTLDVDGGGLAGRFQMPSMGR